MTTFTIPHTTLTIAKRNGASVTVDTSTLPLSILSDLLAYGIRQKVADAASGEPTPEGSQTVMQACIDKLASGEWSIRDGSSSPAADPLDPYRVAIIREQLALPRNATAKAAYLAIDSSDQKARRAYIAALIAKNQDAINQLATERFNLDQANRAASSALAIAI